MLKNLKCLVHRPGLRSQGFQEKAFTKGFSQEGAQAWFEVALSSSSKLPSLELPMLNIMMVALDAALQETTFFMSFF